MQHILIGKYDRLSTGIKGSLVNAGLLQALPGILLGRGLVTDKNIPCPALFQKGNDL